MKRLLARVAAFFTLALLALIITQSPQKTTGVDSTLFSNLPSINVQLFTPVAATSEPAPSEPAATTGQVLSTNTTTQPQETTPYSLTTDGVSADLQSIGYSLESLKAANIDVIASNGKIERRCASGSSGQKSVQGMALLTDTTYAVCPNGLSPVYDAYYAEGAECTVLYNNQSDKKLAILVHELAHCIHFAFGQYRVFDIEYRSVRPAVNNINTLQMAEVIADDFAICKHGLSTNWNVTYYDRYNVSAPTNAQCSEINALIDSFLLSQF